jgi:hypothetical protein
MSNNAHSCDNLGGKCPEQITSPFL